MPAEHENFPDLSGRRQALEAEQEREEKQWDSRFAWRVQMARIT